MNKTKIIATITDKYDEEKLIAIFEAGVNILRLNFSHAQRETTAPLIALVHKLNAAGKTNLGILMDTKGPEVRTGVREQPYTYHKGDEFRIFIDTTKLEQESDMFSDYEYLLEDVKVGHHIAIDGGLMTVTVKEVNTDHLLVHAEHTCEIGSRRHMNFPGLVLRLPGITEKDKADFLMGIQHGIHYVAASFIRTTDNIKEIRDFLDKNGGEQIKIMSKIENQEGVDNIDAIVQLSDAIMIARGDLGIETPIHELPYLQRHIIEVCKKYGRTCIMATELLKSMTTSPFPTRAEVSDVYNSVVAGVDAVMLSDETAIGKFPIETVKLMRETVEKAEKHTVTAHQDFEIVGNDQVGKDKKLISKHALLLADELEAACIIVFSHSGGFPKIIAGLKPNQQVFAFTTNQNVINEMRILYAIQGIKLDKREQHTTENQDIAIKILVDKKYLKSGDKIVIIGDKTRGDKKDPLIRVTVVD